MYTSESHFNTKASDCAIEEIYTNFDINIEREYDPKTGYSFYYPYRFVNDPAQLKAVGVRFLNIEPTSHTMEYKVEVGYYNSNNAFYTSKGVGQCSVLSENNLFEVLTGICKYVNENLIKYIRKQYGWELKYYYFDHNLIFYIWNNKKMMYELNVYLRISGDEEFLKFLNQPTNLSIPDVKNCRPFMHFANVWDRNYIQFHASFSDTNGNFIGLNNDFYSRPSLFYLVPTNASVFNIRFTSDGVNSILPRYCKLVIQLCFVLNYKMFRI